MAGDTAQETSPSFHRFMDAVFGTDWRRTLSRRRQAGLHRRWEGGTFQGRTWADLRRMLIRRSGHE